ncbi:sulfite exporter TauE/SafE family protein [Derxia gummosa]|uniref:Probable membrane transporter protein n=1 Tax=Derxia gummosa DSM 723 TaxID=1121388 RepID=A0A8B6X338_9BURK|nr:TSUP family transporter [Derxia gummosa]
MEVLPWLCAAAFAAGLIDAAVGGGGLVQVPALFGLMPDRVPATLLGTNKLAAACGTGFAVRSYVRRVTLPWRLVMIAAAAAFIGAFAGASVVSRVPSHWMRPVVLVLMIVMAIYTLAKKDFGRDHAPSRIGPRQLAAAAGLGAAIGFYDGVFGPGTGSFLIFLFVRVFAFDFLHASASAKVVNLGTNLASLLFFIPTGHVMWAAALPMAACNMAGALAGTRIAVRRGTGFVRGLFIVLVTCLAAKLGLDVWRSLVGQS